MEKYGIFMQKKSLYILAGSELSDLWICIYIQNMKNAIKTKITKIVCHLGQH